MDEDKKEIERLERLVSVLEDCQVADMDRIKVLEHQIQSKDTEIQMFRFCKDTLTNFNHMYKQIKR